MKDLFILIHGYQGTEHDFDNFEKVLQSKYEQSKQEQVVILKITSNSSSTRDGVEKGAIRIWKEVMQKLKEMENCNNEVDNISIIGHSLGGIYARFLIRLLDDCFIFEKYHPKYFITLASPHLSVRRPQNSPFNILFQSLAKRGCKTTKELCLEDDKIRPLLHRMTDNSFLQVLEKFEYRILYSNISNDFLIQYLSSSISIENPYLKSKILLIGEKEYKHVTKWSIEQVENRRKHEIEERKFGMGDKKVLLLHEMFERLNTLSWERYDCRFSKTLFAHEQIVNKRSSFSGKDVVHHVCDRVQKQSQTIEIISSFTITQI